MKLYNTIKVLGIIPARANSKEIPNKNMHVLCGKPLIEYTIEAAKNSKRLTDFIITTDSEIILERYGGIRRPSLLADDSTPMLPVIKHALSSYERINGEVDAVCLLQPTSPLRTHSHIDNAIYYYDTQSKSRITASLYTGNSIQIKSPHEAHDKHVSGYHFQRNGAIFIASTNLVYTNKLWDEEVFQFEMPSYRSIDIDTIEDMMHAEMLIKGGVLSQ